MALTTDDQDDNTDSSDSTDATPDLSGMTSPSTAGISSLFGQANQDLQNSRQQGITKDQINSLSQHSGANSLVSMFMNMVGAATNTSAKPYTDTLNQSLENQKGALGLQDLVANRGVQRAEAEQNLGMNQLKGNQALYEQQLMQSPLNNVQKALVQTYAKLDKFPVGINPDDIKNQYQLSQVMPGIEKLGETLATQARMEALINKPHLVKGPDGNFYSVSPYSGTNWGTATQNTQNTITPSDKNIVPIENGPGAGKPQSNIVIPPEPQQNPNEFNFNEISSGRKNGNLINLPPQSLTEGRKQIPAIATNYQKEFGQPNIQFQNEIGKLNTFVGDALKGNYVAARSIPPQEAKALSDLTGRLSNYDIQLQKDPLSRGIITDLQGKFNGLAGKGNFTPSEATNLKEVLDQIITLHNQNLAAAQNSARTRVKGIIPQFNDDNYLLGGAYSTQSPDEQKNQENVGGAPIVKFNSFQDLLNKRSGQ